MAIPSIALNARSVRIYYFITAGLLSGFLLYLLSPSLDVPSFPKVFQHATPSQAAENLTVAEPEPLTLDKVTSKYAYVTLLAADSTHDSNIDHDNYFVATRLLAYQLLHAKETKSDDIPFIVMAVRNAKQAKKDRLRKDGAIVIEIDPISLPGWIPAADRPEWVSVWDKLRMWELTQFEKVMFLDADNVLAKPLDGAFENALVQVSDIAKGAVEAIAGIQLPPDYVFAAGMETNVDHDFPPTTESDWERGQYINAGWFITKPSRAVLNYYLAMLAIPNSFKTEFYEQDLLNFIHRPEGPMPWQIADPIWNIHRPTQEDLAAGVHSVHGKWWDTHHKEIMPWTTSWRWRMEGYFERWDELR